jgi:hypothetical protein
MKISQALRPMNAIEDGVWVRPVPEFPKFRVKAKIRADKYKQRMSLRQADWSRTYGALDVPQVIRQRAEADILFEECIVDFEGIEPDPEIGFADASLESVKRICGTYQGQPLYVHFLTAVFMVEGRRAADTEEAVGNSEPSSNGS